MKKVLVTGSSGLVGTAACEKFAKEGWDVIGVDKHLRGTFLGSINAETRGKVEPLAAKYPSITEHEIDVCDMDAMRPLVKDVDAIVHLAAQVSHPRSMEIPMEDARTNITGTLVLLELARQHNHDVPFAFMSSNKVYGDQPNKLAYKIVDDGRYKRYEPDPPLDGFDESMSIDQCGHTPFGVSKVAADLYAQEYAKNFGMATACFRAGCITGANQQPVEAHGFLGFFTKQAVLRKELRIFGGGYRVRDNIHAADVASVLYHWVTRPVRCADGLFGQVYNVGGMRQNSVSIFEALAAIEAKTGLVTKWTDAPERESDHVWWISDMARFKRDYPEWAGITIGLDEIFNELLAHWIAVSGARVTANGTPFF